jgi:hypothetical protein
MSANCWICDSVMVAGGTKRRTLPLRRRLKMTPLWKQMRPVHGWRGAEAGLLFIDDEQHAAVWHMAARRRSQPGGGSITPPALNSGSVVTAAGWPVAWASSSSKLVLRQA